MDVPIYSVLHLSLFLLLALASGIPWSTATAGGPSTCILQISAYIQHLSITFQLSIRTQQKELLHSLCSANKVPHMSSYAGPDMMSSAGLASGKAGT
jgi:hypothetical protein